MSLSTTPIPRSRLSPAALDFISGAILGNSRKSVALAAGLVALIALADYATGYELRLAVLYLLPVFIASWTAGRLAGALIAALATLSWIVIFQSSHLYSRDVYYYWEGAILFGTLSAFSLVLARLRRALAHADERFVTVLEGLDAAVYVSEMNGGKLLYANRRFRDFFGADSETGDAGKIEQPFEVTPADFFARTAAAQGGSAPLSAEFRNPASGRRFLIRASPVTWIDGRSVSLKVATDITEAKQAEDASRQQMEKLQRSSKLITIGEMASALAHELNQPLTAIASYNQSCIRMLRSGHPAAADLLAVMEKCGAQAVRAGGILNRMREFLRKREPARSPQQLNAIVGEAAQLMAMEIERSGVQFSLDLAPALPPVLADAIMIEQVLLNLARNAIEAMQPVARESRRLAIRTAHAGNATLRISVEDSGPGVPAEVLPNLYTAFFSTKENGMGIGLNICRSIVEFHGGTLWHEAGADGGSVFVFTLPAQSA